MENLYVAIKDLDGIPKFFRSFTSAMKYLNINGEFKISEEDNGVWIVENSGWIERY